MMKKKEDRTLDSRDDWLSEEIRREKRISARVFDIQESTKDRRIGKTTARSAIRTDDDLPVNDPEDESDEIISGYQRAKERKASLTWLAIDTIILAIMAIFNRITGIRTNFAVLALYMLLYPVCFAYGAMFKRLLPAKYLIFAAAIALAMEISDIVVRFS